MWLGIIPETIVHSGCTHSPRKTNSLVCMSNCGIVRKVQRGGVIRFLLLTNTFVNSELVSGFTQPSETL